MISLPFFSAFALEAGPYIPGGGGHIKTLASRNVVPVMYSDKMAFIYAFKDSSSGTVRLITNNPSQTQPGRARAGPDAIRQ